MRIFMTITMVYLEDDTLFHLKHSRYYDISDYWAKKLIKAGLAGEYIKI